MYEVYVNGKVSFHSSLKEALKVMHDNSEEVIELCVDNELLMFNEAGCCAFIISEQALS